MPPQLLLNPELTEYRKAILKAADELQSLILGPFEALTEPGVSLLPSPLRSLVGFKAQKITLSYLVQLSLLPSNDISD